jgi:hypothetical protein
MKPIIGIALLIGIMVLGALLTGYDFAMFKFWAPKYENAKREVFENTQGYVQGKVSYLTTLRFQYGSASGDQKEALRNLILSEASTVDNDKLPGDLRGFVEGLK